MLDTLNIKHINSLGSTDEANCWGSTQYALGYLDKPVWQQQEAMEEFLRLKTYKAIGRQVGDILVMRDANGELVHTAVYRSTDNWWHKAGKRAAEFTTFKRMHNIYEHDYSYIEYRRFVGGCYVRDVEIDLYEERGIRKFIKTIKDTIKLLFT